MGDRGGEVSPDKRKCKDTEVAEIGELVRKKKVRSWGTWRGLGNKEGEQSEVGSYR